MNFKVIIALLSYILFTSCTTINKNSPVIDKNLINPGQSAEGFSIGESFEDNSNKINKNGSIADILNVDCFSELKFDSFVYNKDSSILFLNNGIITAIVGLKTDRRVTTDAVLLSNGIDNFILNYGNKGLLTIRKGNHCVYLYKKLGIAIFNDNNDGSIDMYLIFKN